MYIYILIYIPLYIYIYIYIYICVVYIYILIYNYTFIYIYIYIYICKQANLPVNAIVRLAHPWSEDGRETFLTPSVDNQTQKCDTECSNHCTSLSSLRVNEISNLRRYAALSFLQLHSFHSLGNKCFTPSNV